VGIDSGRPRVNDPGKPSWASGAKRAARTAGFRDHDGTREAGLIGGRVSNASCVSGGA